MERREIFLTELAAGREARVTRLEGGRPFRQGLEEMGLRAGVVLRLLQGARGPVLVQVGETRLALGRGMAEKIRIEPLEESQ